MASLEFDAVSKSYDQQHWTLRDLSFTVSDGEFLVLVGPSGCGKTTALRMLAGFEDISQGEIRIGGVRINETPPRERDIAMVFQNYALYPHMTVADNIGYGLKVRGMAKAERRARVVKTAEMLGLSAELDRKPSQLSGGQRQRVAMGRAIVREPQAFLMDEPLSNLDARLRVRMRTEIARLQRDLNVTTVYVTHDQVEAMTMADRVAVMNGGLLQQLDTPQRIYAHPANLFVATFIGSPAMNILKADLSKRDDQVWCKVGDYSFPLPASTLNANPGIRAALGTTIAIGVRPNAVTVTGGQYPNGLPGEVRIAEGLGSEVLAHIEVAASRVETEAASEAPDLPLGHTDTSIIVASLKEESLIARGERVTLTFDSEHIHFFDPQTGASLRSGAATAPSSAPTLADLSTAVQAAGAERVV
jgi:multiple sugar transport system ATP-binding protein